MGDEILGRSSVEEKGMGSCGGAGSAEQEEGVLV